MKKGNLDVVQGGKKPDIVTIKVLHAATNPTGFVAFSGGCDLDTFERTLEALEEQGYIDLVDRDGIKLRVFKEGVLAVIHIGTQPRQPKGLIVPMAN